MINLPQKDLAIEARSNTRATPKSAVRKTASDSTSTILCCLSLLHIIFMSVCLLTEFYPSLAVKEHILWFEVSVDDPLLMTAVHRLTYLIQHLENEL